MANSTRAGRGRGALKPGRDTGKLSERHLDILRTLLEYRYLTARDLWQVLEPQNQDATAMAHKLRQLSDWGLVRGERLNLQRGGGDPMVFSLLQSGGEAVGKSIGSQYYRRPIMADIQYQGLRLQFETALSRGGYEYIRPMAYNRSQPKPQVTPQSTHVIQSMVAIETARINDALQRVRQSWYSRRWEPGRQEVPVLNAADEPDPFAREWLVSLQEDRQLQRDHQERKWREHRVYQWLFRHGLLDPADVPDAIISRIVRVNSGTIHRQVPRQLNDYVAWAGAGTIVGADTGARAGAGTVAGDGASGGTSGRADSDSANIAYSVSGAVYPPIAVVLYRADRDVRSLRATLEQYRPIVSQMECALIVGDNIREQMALRELVEQRQLRGFVCIPITEWTTYLARRQPLLI